MAGITIRGLSKSFGANAEVAAVADLSLNRPNVTQQENVRYNATLRAEWEGRNHSIAARNALRLRRTPVRVRATGTS